MSISGPLLLEITNLLVESFSLNQFDDLLHALDIERTDIIIGHNYPEIVESVVEELGRKGRLEEFLRAAIQQLGKGTPPASPAAIKPFESALVKLGDPSISVHDPSSNLQTHPEARQSGWRALTFVLLAVLVLLATAFGIFLWRGFSSNTRPEIATPVLPPTPSSPATIEPHPATKPEPNALIPTGITSPTATVVDAVTLIPPVSPQPTNPPPPSLTPTALKAIAPGTLKLPTPKAVVGCQRTRLKIGDWAYIPESAGLNGLRKDPSTISTDNIIYTAGPGELVLIQNGPECDAGYQLWNVYIPDVRKKGWLAEIGPQGEFWLTPYQVTEACAGYQTHLSIGMTAIVVPYPAQPNSLRDAPGGNPIGTASANEQISILEGPICRNEMVWWKVRNQRGVEGWTAERDIKQTWIIPAGQP
jgi:hypothetical protein